ncbi:hypothetical protein GCM10027047_04390 [Rhodococcus aerolatus]
MSQSHHHDPGSSEPARPPRRRDARRRLTAGLLGLTTAIAVVGLAPSAAAQGVSTAPAAAPKALLNLDTAPDGASSSEAVAATAAGFDVTVVTGAEWSTLTQADFASYQLLIAGDPNGQVPTSFSANEATWGPVVMGTAVNTRAGNRVVLGTDPTDHAGSHPGANVLIADGIAFAGAQPGRTGLYFTASEGAFAQGGVAPILQSLSSGTGTWTENDSPPCGGNVAKVASNPQFDSLSSSDLAGWGCSVHESFPTFADDWLPLAVATDTASTPVCGTDADTGATACGEPYVLVAGSGVVVTSPDLALTPTTGSDPVGSPHTVTASVTRGGSPVAGQLVVFTVTGQNDGATGTCSPAPCTTDANGQVSFTYTGTSPGDDTINVSFTDAASGTKQQATAAETWTAAPITATGVAVTASTGVPVTAPVATFTDPDTSVTAAAFTASISWGDGTTASAGTITGGSGSFSVSGTHTYATPGAFTVTTTITPTATPSGAVTATSTATVVASTTVNTYGVSGTATRPGGASMPFGPGSLKATVGATGFTDGVLTLPGMTYTGRLLGVVPVTVTAHVETTGPVTGTVTGSSLAVAGSINLVVDQILVAGRFPLLAPGGSCRTTTPSAVTLTGPATTLTAGGTLTGSYRAADFSGCGPFGFALQPFLSSAVSGTPTAISATLVGPTATP